MLNEITKRVTIGSMVSNKSTLNKISKRIDTNCKYTGSRLMKTTKNLWLVWWDQNEQVANYSLWSKRELKQLYKVINWFMLFIWQRPYGIFTVSHSKVFLVSVSDCNQFRLTYPQKDYITWRLLYLCIRFSNYYHLFVSEPEWSQLRY